MHALLAARSNFSIGESILSIERLVDAGVKAGATAIALTDTMTVSGKNTITLEDLLIGEVTARLKGLLG